MEEEAEAVAEEEEVEVKEVELAEAVVKGRESQRRITLQTIFRSYI